MKVTLRKERLPKQSRKSRHCKRLQNEIAAIHRNCRAFIRTFNRKERRTRRVRKESSSGFDTVQIRQAELPNHKAQITSLRSVPERHWPSRAQPTHHRFLRAQPSASADHTIQGRLL